MATFDIYYEVPGDYYEGAYVEPVRETGTVELTDDEVETLVNLIREKNSADVNEIGLEASHPEIYEKLYQAYYRIGAEAEEMFSLWNTFTIGEHLDVCTCDREGLIAYCKENCGFVCEGGETGSAEECIAFSKWLNDYVHSLGKEEVKRFFYDHMGMSYGKAGFKPTVDIPQAIINMAFES